MSVVFFIFVLLWLGFTGVSSNGTASEQSCAVDSPNGIQRCGPETSDGLYRLPGEGVVIRAIVNNGPVSPEAQEGYEIEIDVSGAVTIRVIDGERDPIVRTESIGVGELQEMLTHLEGCQFYYLPQTSEFDDSDIPDGASVSLLDVHLRNGDWSVSGVTLTASERVRFDSCQDDLAERFDLDPRD